MARVEEEARAIVAMHGCNRKATHLQLDIVPARSGKANTPRLSAVNLESTQELITRAAALRPAWRNGQRALDPAGVAPGRGFAFARFAERAAAEAAVTYGDGQLSLRGRVLRVRWAHGSKGRRRRRAVAVAVT
jgi:hypothetical protein